MKQKIISQTHFMESMHMQIADLRGNFHAHITLNTSNDTFEPPKGWKTTIILLSKDDRHQKDVMITRHFKTGTTKTEDVAAIKASIDKTTTKLVKRGFDVVRVKLEHESLPTMPASEGHYRECHIKIKAPVGYQIKSLQNYVQSRNPMSSTEIHFVTFLNARFYSGSVEDIDAQIAKDVIAIKNMNPIAELLEIKIESAILDTNISLDRWWA